MLVLRSLRAAPLLRRATARFEVVRWKSAATDGHGAAREADTQSSENEDQVLRLRVLSAALKHVPSKGWTEEALALGAVDSGLRPVSHGIFKRGPIELVEYYMEEAAYETARLVESRWAELIEGKSEQEKMGCVIDLRLQQLEPYVSNWAQAMALGAHPRNAATTARNLALLADEMCHTAGLDHGLDHGAGEAARWYTDRAVVAAVYGAAEVFMLSDKSPGFEDTRDFVKRRVAEAYALLDQKASPLGADSMDARVDALCSALPVPPQVASELGARLRASGVLRGARRAVSAAAQSEAAATVASASAQLVMGVLASLLPAGAPAQRPGRYGDPPSGEQSYGPATEDSQATPTEAAEYDPKPNGKPNGK